MDVMELARSLEEFARQPQKGDTLGLFAERCRTLNAKNPDFWSLVIDTMKMLALAELGADVIAECGSLLICLLQAVALASIPTENAASAVKVEPPRYQATRAPPKRFIPVPKTEIGGCARSDSLIHSLVF
ncbi:MAG: hypothetical protein ACRCZS_21010 [Chroococcidiopsis sp.]